jgi:hypothetical protein
MAGKVNLFAAQELKKTLKNTDFKQVQIWNDGSQKPKKKLWQAPSVTS